MYPGILLKLSIVSRSFLVEYSESFVCDIVSPTDRNIFTFIFPICGPVMYFALLLWLVLLTLYQEVVVGDPEQPCLNPDLNALT